MNQLQTINNISGKPEYVLLPINVYKVLRRDIIQAFKTVDQEYEDFDPKDFIKNPIALLRMRAKITQTELAKRLKVTQAYISKIENDNYNVTSELLKKIKKALKTK
ncbi:MAG: helix-turn-helix transcriptional regulator [Gammaproteobacteria bacterium]|jgi:DNA-binding XRE family transcriptional regulator